MELLYWQRWARFFRFLGVGATVAAIDFSLVWLLRGFLPPLFAVSVAYFAGVACHFLLNKFWVFRCKRSDYARQLGQYGITVIVSWLITVAVVQLCLATFTRQLLIAKLCAIPAASITAFACMQLLVFRARVEKPTASYSAEGAAE
jgi:putative flippase GtrA